MEKFNWQKILPVPNIPPLWGSCDGLIIGLLAFFLKLPGDLNRIPRFEDDSIVAELGRRGRDHHPPGIAGEKSYEKSKFLLLLTKYRKASGLSCSAQLRQFQ